MGFSKQMQRDLDRSGSSQGLGAVGASSDVANVLLNLDGRRGSTGPTSSPGPSSLPRGKASSNPNVNLAFTQELLAEIGQVEGISPPTHGPQQPVPELSTVVSAGLEMGLGVHLATSALHNNLPGASAAVSSLAEPRFARPATIDFNAITLAAKLTEREVWTDDRGPRSSTFEDPSMVAFNHAEAELARRRTTGSAPASTSGRKSDVVRNRAGTHDFSARPPVVEIGRRINLSMAPNPVEERSSASTPSIDYSSSMGDRHRASITCSTQIGTPYLNDKALLSPATSHHMSSAGDFSGEGKDRSLVQSQRQRSHNRPNLHPPAHQNSGQIGVGGGGHFGPGVRAKVLEVLDQLISAVPVSDEEGATISIAEFGCLNGRSLPLMQPIVTSFLENVHGPPSSTRKVQEDDFFGPNRAHPLSTESCRINFSMIHEDAPQADFRPLMQQIDNTSESYMNPIWQSRCDRSIQNAVFPSFVARPFASRIAPPNTLHFGLSLMDMHWSHTPANPAIASSTLADAELTAFLNTRANEFKQGGVLVIAYIARSDDEDRHSAGIARGRDMWTMLTNVMAPCIQRLVSCGMLKSDIARHMLSLPIHPRTMRQTANVLKSVSHQWNVAWSCGLGESGDSERGCSSEPDPVRLSHPAWKALRAGTLSRVAFSEHMIQLFKNLYENHFRALLREKGKLSKGAVEFVLDSLWDVIHSRIDDQNSNLLEGLELEVCIYALRRL